MDIVHVKLVSEEGLNEVIGVVKTDDTYYIHFEDVVNGIKEYNGYFPTLCAGDKIVIEVMT